MTDKELKEIVASLAVDRKEIERILKESSLEFDRRMEKAEKRFEKSEKRFEKIEKRLDKLGVQIGGINDNIGYHAEQFFQDVFEDKLEFGRMKYDEMIPNLTHKGKGVEIEFDIALLNGNSVALIEVKNRIHPIFVKELAEDRVGKFRKFFPEYNDYDVYLGIAGFSFSDEVLDQASRYGIGIVKQVGEGVEIEASNLKAY